MRALGAKHAVLLTTLLVALIPTTVNVLPRIVAKTFGGNPEEVQHFLFFSARRCTTSAEGCALGGMLGGLGAAERVVETFKRSGGVRVFWAGRTFDCLGDAPGALASAAATQGVSAVGVSLADAQLALPRLRSLMVKSRVPWVLTNGARRDGPTPWKTFVDVPLVGGHIARVFALAAGRHEPTTASLFLDDPVHALRRAIAASPPGRVHVVLVSTDRRSVLDAVGALPSVHVVFDGDEAAPEPYTADETRDGVLVGGVRGNGQAVFRLSFRPTGEFQRWTYARAFGVSLPAKTSTLAHWAYMSAVELVAP